MRVISQPIQTYSVQLGAGPLVQQAIVIPNFGPVAGFYLDLTVSLTGATASQTSQSIDNVISTFQIDDVRGDNVVYAVGTDLSVLNDALTPRGVRQSPPTITTSGAGAGSAEWYVFLPITISAKDSPGQLKITFAPSSSLVTAGLVSAGTVQVTLVMRAGYDVHADQPTLRVQISNPPHQAGLNNFGPYLPQGFQAEALVWVLTGGDADFGYVTLFHGGATLATLQPLHDFTAQDTMLMQSGHLSGEFITRYPVFVVDSTSVLLVNLSTDTATRLYSIATIPQKRD